MVPRITKGSPVYVRSCVVVGWSAGRSVSVPNLRNVVSEMRDREAPVSTFTVSLASLMATAVTRGVFFFLGHGACFDRPWLSVLSF